MSVTCKGFIIKYVIIYIYKFFSLIDSIILTGILFFDYIVFGSINLIYKQ